MTVTDEIKAAECTGCGACAAVCPKKCIKMSADNEGFLRPSISADECINCGLCVNTCPVKAAQREPLSKLPAAYLAWANNEELIKMSTSGGLVSAIAYNTLKSGGVVVGAVYDKNDCAKVHHSIIDNLEELEAFSRSKYVQSELSQELYHNVGNILDTQNRRVLFVGTACQVYGLKLYLKRVYKKRFDDKLLTVDLVCYGVPSPKLLQEYKSYMETTKNCGVNRIEMRSKKNDYSFFSDADTIVYFDDGSKHVANTAIDLYGRFFYGKISSRPSCYNCKFKTIGRISDLTVGDCWFSRALSGTKQIPYDVTLAIVHSDAGNNALQLPEIKSIQVDTEKAIKCNGGMIYSSAQMHPKRDLFFERVGKEPLDSIADDLVPLAIKPQGKKDLVKKIIKSIPFVYIYIYKKYYFIKKEKQFKDRLKRHINQDAYFNTKL